jgi:Mg2+/citrate symporter
MGWGDDDDNGWDDERVGYGDNSRAHRWAHEWMFWLSVVFALAGILALIGAVRPFSVFRVVGALAILGAIPVLKQSDRALDRDTRAGMQQLGLSLALAVGGAGLFLSSA